MGKRIERAKPRKFEDEDKKTLIRKTKLTWKQSKIRNSFITSHWKSLAPPFSLLLRLSVISCGMEYPSGKFGSAVPAMSPPSFLHTPVPLMKGSKRGKDKALLLCKYCSAIGKTLLCFQHWFSYKSKTENGTGCE